MPRVARFSTEAAFSAHRRSARRVENCFFTAFVAEPADGLARFAAVASKARIGGAVERNRAKRRLRAAFAKAAPKTPLAVILYAKKPALAGDFAEIVAALREALG